MISKVHIWRAFETSPLYVINVGVIVNVSAHDIVQGIIGESMLPTLELKGDCFIHIVPCISGEEFEYRLRVYAHKKI